MSETPFRLRVEWVWRAGKLTLGCSAALRTPLPTCTGMPERPQIWELFKSLLALQAGDGDGDGDGGGQVCLAAVLGEQEGEPDDESEWSNDSEDDVLGYEAALPGDKASGERQRQALGMGESYRACGAGCCCCWCWVCPVAHLASARPVVGV